MSKFDAPDYLAEAKAVSQKYGQFSKAKLYAHVEKKYENLNPLWKAHAQQALGK